MQKNEIFYIFLVFNVFSKIGNKIIVIQLDLSSYIAIIIAIQTAVIDQFIALKNLILSEANQIKIFCSVYFIPSPSPFLAHIKIITQ